ncbi:unnamed protein product, partial [Didymodactylos carnosus]
EQHEEASYQIRYGDIDKQASLGRVFVTDSQKKDAVENDNADQKFVYTPTKGEQSLSGKQTVYRKPEYLNKVQQSVSDGNRILFQKPEYPEVSLGSSSESDDAKADAGQLNRTDYPEQYQKGSYQIRYGDIDKQASLGRVFVTDSQKKDAVENDNTHPKIVYAPSKGEEGLSGKQTVYRKPGYLNKVLQNVSVGQNMAIRNGGAVVW